MIAIDSGVRIASIVGMFRPTQKACETCGTVVTMRGHQRYCDRCMERTCAACGATFRVRQVTASNRYCSHRCYALSLKGATPHNKGDINRRTATCGYCGEQFDAEYNYRQRYCSKRCFGLATRGENNAQWRAGANHRRQSLIAGGEYLKWRAAVLSRDQHQCVLCKAEGATGDRRLHAHHIQTVAARPDLIGDIDNGVTVCKTHHLAMNGREEFFAARLVSLIVRRVWH